MDIRLAVMEFAELMEEVLQENDHKGGWANEDFDYLFDRLTEEKRELRNLFYRPDFMLSLELKPSKSKKEAIKEAVDVANFCMMIVDNLRRKQ